MTPSRCNNIARLQFNLASYHSATCTNTIRYDIGCYDCFLKIFTKIYKKYTQGLLLDYMIKLKHKEFSSI